jgi:DNA-binding response OmpR family regulator
MMFARVALGPVVIAEDDPALLSSFRDAFRSADAVAITARSARVALEAVAFHRPAVAVIDLAMEDGRGWELLYAIASRPGTSVVALDRRGEALVRRGALMAGADDVLSAPFDLEELVTRAGALERRQRVEPATAPVLRHRDLLIDVAAHEVRVAGRLVPLTPQQFALLRALVEARGATLHRTQLLARIASIDGEPPSDRAVDLHMSRLRRRLGDDDGRYIAAVYGIGYRLSPAADRTATAAIPAGPVLDALDDAVILTDQSLRIVAANRAARRLLERDRAEIVGLPCADVMACRTCGGAPLFGPACIGRAALAGDAAIGHVRATVRGGSDPLNVVFSHSPVRSPEGAPLLAIQMRYDDG